MISFRPLDFLALSTCLWIVYRALKIARSRARATKLTGPPSKSWLFGVSKEVFDGDNGAIYEAWAQKYGSVYGVAGPLGERRVILTDPKAIAHIYAKPYVYVKDQFNKFLFEDLIGKGILWADGDDHKRQRKALNPPFTSGSIREIVPIFYESGYKAKAAWDDIVSKTSTGEAVINIQKWMNCISLDSIGIAGFGYDFGALRGVRGAVEEAFDSLGGVPIAGMTEVLFLLGPLYPSFLSSLPTGRQKTLQKLNRAMLEIAEGLLEETKKDKEDGTLGASSRSIVGALIRSEEASAKSTMTKDEVLSQMRTLILAGYETTSISMTWALIELALHPEKQDRLRKEVLDQYVANNGDLTYDQVMNELPYLDSVLREILRLHPSVETNDRTAACDDIVPLTEPVKTSNGESVNEVKVGAGTLVIVPIRAINRSEKIWGPDAKEFKPERWLDQESGLTSKSKEYTGYHHLLSFTGGPRICLGRLFAVAEFKVVLSVLVRNFVFDMRDGLKTKVEVQTTLLPRPKVAGEDGYSMPMRIRRVNVGRVH